MELSMVALKIRDKEDILTAYLKSFGFSGNKLKALSENLLQKLPGLTSKDGEKLISYTDKIILKNARLVFKSAALSDEQLLAQFKLCFLLCRGADFCSLENLKNTELPADLIKQMQNHFIINAPQYHFAVMKPQKIESFHTKKKKNHD